MPEQHDDDDIWLVDTLTDLGINKQIEETGMLTTRKQGYITDFFNKLKTDHKDNKDIAEWKGILEKSARSQFESDKGTLNERISQGIKAGQLWGERNNQTKTSGSCRTTTIQDHSAKPIMLGCDVLGLYPNLDPVSVAQVAADAVRMTETNFNGIDFGLLSIYLLLTLGRSTLFKAGLGGCIPRRKNKSNSASLTSLGNRDINNWDTSVIRVDDWSKKEILAHLIQNMILLMTSSTCYKFGGHIYMQKGGLGIGLRGSAALERLAKCRWDGL